MGTMHITSMTSKVNPARFFDKISKAEIEWPGQIEPMVLPELEPQLDAETFTVNSLAVVNAQRGDILVALPKHGKKFSLINFENEQFKVGHTSILTTNITTSTSPNAFTSVEAWMEGGGACTK